MGAPSVGRKPSQFIFAFLQVKLRQPQGEPGNSYSSYQWPQNYSLYDGPGLATRAGSPLAADGSWSSYDNQTMILMKCGDRSNSQWDAARARSKGDGL